MLKLWQEKEKKKKNISENVSTEDRKDSKALYSIIIKIEENPLIPLTAEEEKLLAKYNLAREGSIIYLDIPKNRDTIDMDLILNSRRLDKGSDKVNYVDRVKKLMARKKSRLLRFNR